MAVGLHFSCSPGRKVEETLRGQWASGDDTWDASGLFKWLGQASSLSVEAAGCFTQWESCFATVGPLCSASVLLTTS